MGKSVLLNLLYTGWALLAWQGFQSLLLIDSCKVTFGRSNCQLSLQIQSHLLIETEMRWYDTTTSSITIADIVLLYAMPHYCGTMLRRIVFFTFICGAQAFVPKSLSNHPPKATTGAPFDGIFFQEPSTRSFDVAVKPKQCFMKNSDENDRLGGYLENFKDKPGMLLLLPFVFLIGIDLVLNIAFIVKRSLEYFLFGQAPSTETWW